MFAQPRQRQIDFSRGYQVYSASFADREDIQYGDKILLPPSALGQLYPLMTSNNKNPLIFCIKNGSRFTYCGVLQFVADQGICYIPFWMYKLLKFKDNQNLATISLVNDLKTTKEQYTIKIRPHLTKFIDLPNVRAILQFHLRSYTCLHEGDTIAICFQSQKYQIDIISILPKTTYNAICIIGVDVNVEFQAPLDYVEPQKYTPVVQKKEGPFTGQCIRIDQKVEKNQRKTSGVIQLNEEDQYDPRKHRIHRGIRKNSIDWTKGGIKLGKPVGTK